MFIVVIAYIFFIALLAYRKNSQKSYEPIKSCEKVESYKYVDKKPNQTYYLKDNTILELQIYPTYENKINKIEPILELLPIPFLV